MFVRVDGLQPSVVLVVGSFKAIPAAFVNAGRAKSQSDNKTAMPNYLPSIPPFESSASANSTTTVPKWLRFSFRVYRQEMGNEQHSVETARKREGNKAASFTRKAANEHETSGNERRKHGNEDH